MLVADLQEGDILYFPTAWLHEVHNLTPDSKILTNAVPWINKSKQKNEEEKRGKRTFGEALGIFRDY